MNILHISAQKPDSTGSGIYMSGVIDGFKKLGIRQSLIVGIDIIDSKTSIEKKFDGEVSVYPLIYNSGRLDFNVPGMSDNMPYPSTRYRDLTAEQSTVIKEEFSKLLLEVIEKEKPDIILCHHLYYITSIVRELLPDKKVFAICHGTCLRQLVSNTFNIDYILENIRNVDKIFALHDEQKNIIMKVFNMDSSKVCVLGSGYDSSIFYNKKLAKNGKIRISYAGKISYSKGLVPMINSLKRLDIPTDYIEIIMAGGASDYTEFSHIKKLAQDSKYKIDFIGKINQQELAELFNRSDIFILPSYYEGLPLVVLEALACGCYVICTNTEGLEQWLSEDIKNSGLFDFVELPKMENIHKPQENEIEGFEERLKNSIKKAVEYRKIDRSKKIDISNLSWEELSKKLLIFLLKYTND